MSWTIYDDTGKPVISQGDFSITITGDTGTDTITDGETLDFVGGTGLTSAVTGGTVTYDFNGLSLTTQTSQIEILLDNTTLGSSSSFDVDLSSGEALNCEHLMIKMRLRGALSASTDAIAVYFNNDTTATNYYRQTLTGINLTPTSVRTNTAVVASIPANTADADDFGMVTFEIIDFRGSKEKTSLVNFGYFANSTTTESGSTMHFWNNTSAITRIQIRTDNHPTDLLASASEIWIYGTKSVSVLTNVTVL